VLTNAFEPKRRKKKKEKEKKKEKKRVTEMYFSRGVVSYR